MKVFLILLLYIQALSCYALSSSQVTISRSTAPFFILDSNNPCNAGPRAAYIGVKVVNKSTTDTLFNMIVKMDSIVGVSGFRLLGPTDSSENVGRILPRDSVTAYFYVKYPCTHNTTANYFFKISNNQSGMVTFNTTVFTRSSISAQAGGDLLSQKIGYYDALGTVMADTVFYDFGNVQKDDELVIQPNGDTTFRASRIRLLNSQIIYSDIPAAIPVGTRDKLYFISPQSYGGSAKLVRVVYFFLNHLYNDSTSFFPYAGLTSGATNFKYSGNYGTTTIGSSGMKTTTASKKITTTIRTSCGICNPCDTMTYSVIVRNTSSTYMQVDQIIFRLPQGCKYAGFASGSDVNLSNSSSYPVLGDSGLIYFKGYIPQPVFPFESYLINANDSIVLKFKAKMRCTSTDTIDVATAISVLGSILIDSAKATSCVGCSVLPVNLLFFNANMVQNQVLLEWATASELNNEKFSVYRSYEGLFYELITELPGAGNCQQITNYSAVDQHFLHVNRIYYKLKQTDYDGKQAEYFTKLNLKQPLIINCYPNPFSNELDIQFSYESQLNSIVISDFSGKIVQYLNEAQLNQQTHVKINTFTWIKGMYVVKCLSTEGKYSVFKLIKH